jgi:uncharacterized glyoxalase superfamily protein PhnB
MSAVGRKQTFDKPLAATPRKCRLVVHVKNIDAHFEAARSAGATILSEPTDQPYGQREYAVRDPDGHSWWIATPTAAPALKDSN